MVDRSDVVVVVVALYVIEHLGETAGNPVLLPAAAKLDAS